MRRSMNPGSLEPPIWLTFFAWLLIALAAVLGEARAQTLDQNTVFLLLPSAVRTATTNSADQANPAWRGGHVIMNVTAVPGVDSITMNIQGRDPVSGTYYTILQGLAETTTGIKVYKVYPGITAAANASASDILPSLWRVSITHSAGSNFTYSVGYFYEK
jgi:hypothetical protein